jgi:citrate lyase subunit beta/citryl-CoA lyase
LQWREGAIGRILRIMNIRSLLFVPAHRPERFSKALASGADAVIIDLEDAVAPGLKAQARASLWTWLAQASPEQVPAGVAVRINAEAAWQADDLALCAAFPAVHTVMVPKAESALDMERVAAASGGRALLALIETACGYESRREIASVSAVHQLAFGSIDFQADLGIRGEGDALLTFRSGLVLASRLAGLPPPIDGVTVEVNDTAAVRADAQRARDLGFAGKLCIHPAQVGPVNEAFSPSTLELDWAERVVAAMNAAGGAAVAVDGKMVDKPVLLRAQALLAQRR